MLFHKIKISLTTAFVLMAVSMIYVSCNKQPIGPTGPDPVGPAEPGQYITLADFRALNTTGGDITIPAGTKKFRAVVISNSANEAAGNYRIQDESGAGVILYTVLGSPVYATGQVLEIDAAGVGILGPYNGDLELRNVPQAKVTPLGGALTITPRTATAAQVAANINSWSSTMTTISNLTSITQGSTNSTGTNYTVTDATGSLTLFVRAASGITVNTAGKTITGYVSLYNGTPQIAIRTAADIK